MNMESVSAIVRYLNDHKDVKQVHLKEVIGNHYRLHATMDALKEAGLVEVKFQTSPKREYHYWLTDKGRLVALKLEEVEQIIASD